MLFRFKYILPMLSSFMLWFNAKAQKNYTLQQALQTARVNNSILKTEQVNTDMVKTDIIAAKLYSNPTLSYQALQLTQPSTFTTNTNWHDAQNRQVLWQLSKTFQVADQRRNKIDVANKNVTFTEKNYIEAERNLFYDVAFKWLEVWTAQKQLDMLNIAKNNMDSLIIGNKIRYRNQVITQTDVLRTELLLKQYTVQYETADLELSNKRRELGFLIGIQDSVSVDPTDNFLFNIPEKIDSLLSQSMLNRSDILKAKSLIEVSKSNIKLQKSLAFPQPEIGLMWNPQNRIPYFGISATIDLPFFNRNQAEVKKSYLLKEQAEQHFFTVQSQLQTEISTAFTNHQLQKQHIKHYQTILQQAQTILNNVKYTYLRGATSIIDVLEAQRSWLETQQQYHYTLQQYRQSYIQLLYTTGLINQLAQ